MVYSVSVSTISMLILGYFSNSVSLRNLLVWTSVAGYLGGAALYYYASLVYPADLERDSDMPEEAPVYTTEVANMKSLKTNLDF